jgi:hypothetical protein
MRKTSVLYAVVALIVFAVGAAFAQGHRKPMTNDDVVAMVKAGLPDETILHAMQEQDTDFDGSAAALINLKNQGVSVKVIDAMLDANKHHASSPASAASGSASGTAAGSGQDNPPASGAQQPGNGFAGGTQNSPGATPAGSAASAPAHTSFFDKLSQVQNQVTSAVQQTQGTAQQLQGTAQQMRGAAHTGQGTSAPAAPSAPALPAVTPAASASPAPPAAPTQAAQQSALQQQRQQQWAARQAALQQRRQQQAAASPNQAALQQQRQQQAAAVQQRVAKLTACRDQAVKARQSGDANYQKNYTACVQAAMQSK